MQSSYGRDGGFSSFLAIRRSVATLKDGIKLSLVPGSGDSGDSTVVLFIDPLLNYLQWKAVSADAAGGALALQDITHVTSPGPVQGTRSLLVSTRGGSLGLHCATASDHAACLVALRFLTTVSASASSSSANDEHDPLRSSDDEGDVVLDWGSEMDRSTDECAMRGHTAGTLSGRRAPLEEFSDQSSQASEHGDEMSSWPDVERAGSGGSGFQWIDEESSLGATATAAFEKERQEILPLRGPPTVDRINRRSSVTPAAGASKGQAQKDVGAGLSAAQRAVLEMMGHDMEEMQGLASTPPVSPGGRRIPRDSVLDVGGAGRSAAPSSKPTSELFAPAGQSKKRGNDVDLKFLKLSREDTSDSADRMSNDTGAGSSLGEEREATLQSIRAELEREYMGELAKMQDMREEKKQQLFDLKRQLRRNQERNKALKRKLELQEQMEAGGVINPLSDSAASETGSVSSSATGEITDKISAVRAQLRRAEAMNSDLWSEVERRSVDVDTLDLEVRRP